MRTHPLKSTQSAFTPFVFRCSPPLFYSIRIHSIHFPYSQLTSYLLVFDFQIISSRSKSIQACSPPSCYFIPIHHLQDSMQNFKILTISVTANEADSSARLLIAYFGQLSGSFCRSWNVENLAKVKELKGQI